MAFIDALQALNRLKQRRAIRDYAVIGAVAAARYIEPMSTADLDVIVLVDTDEEYLRAFGAISEYSEGQDGMHHILGGVPVQVFPSSLIPLYHDTLAQAQQTRVGSVRTKVATAEHLILLGLLANREQDHFRIRRLLRHAHLERIGALLERYDDEENTLAARLEDLRGTSVPREGEMAPPPRADEL